MCDQWRSLRGSSLRVSLAQGIVTGLELCQRLYPTLSGAQLTALIDEGAQLPRMTHRLMQWLGTAADTARLDTHDSKLKNSQLPGISRAVPRGEALG